MIYPWGLFLFALALSACSDSPEPAPTQFVLLVDAEEPLRTQLDRIEIETEHGSATLFARAAQGSSPDAPGPNAWPRSIGISPAPRALRGPLRVKGFAGDQEVVRRTLDISLDPARKRRVLSVFLSNSCRDAFSTCDALNRGTCLPCQVGCEPNLVDASELPELTRGQGVTTAWVSEACMDDTRDGGLDAAADAAADAASHADSGSIDASNDSGPPPERPTRWRPIAVSGTHLCAIRGDDRGVYCLGSNAKGQLGVAQGTEPPDWRTPVRVGGASPLVGAVQVAVGYDYSCALLDDRRVYCWGSRDEFRTGTRDQGLAHSPHSVMHAEGKELLPLEDIVDVITGTQHACALNAAGRVFCWGSNGYQELGLNSSESAISGASEVTIGSSSPVRLLGRGGDTTCVVTDAEELFCWGGNEYGQAGVTPHASDAGVPLVLNIGTPTRLLLEEEARPVKEIAGSNAHMVLLAENQSVWTWGSNFFGQLGRSAPLCDDPNLTPYDCTGVPGQAPDLGAFGVALGVVGQATCVITDQPDKPDRQLWCLNGSVSRVGPALSQVSFVAGDTISSVGCALTASGDVYCWGALTFSDPPTAWFGTYPEVALVPLPSAE